MQARKFMYKSIAIVGLVALFACFFATRPAAAHGIDRLLRAEYELRGGYALTVWTSPSRLRPGEVHVDVQVRQADGTPSAAPFVQVHITPQGEAGEPQQTIARPMPLIHEGRDPATHEARFQLEAAGNYAVRVAVTGEEGYLGDVTFAVEVTPVALATKIVIHLLLLASSAVGLWLLRMGVAIWLPAAWLPHTQLSMSNE